LPYYLPTPNVIRFLTTAVTTAGAGAKEATTPTFLSEPLQVVPIECEPAGLWEPLVSPIAMELAFLIVVLELATLTPELFLKIPVIQQLSSTVVVAMVKVVPEPLPPVLSESGTPLCRHPV
jgi:hypothetical protein